SEYAWMYSSAWKNRNRQPSNTVAPSHTSKPRRLAALSAWWATVMVAPDVRRIKVLTSGSPQAGMVWYAPPIPAGPLLGQAVVKASHNNALVIMPSPAPPSHGSESWRA